jgi:hypothetical protein
MNLGVFYHHAHTVAAIPTRVSPRNPDSNALYNTLTQCCTELDESRGYDTVYQPKMRSLLVNLGAGESAADSPTISAAEDLARAYGSAESRNLDPVRYLDSGRNFNRSLCFASVESVESSPGLRTN